MISLSYNIAGMNIKKKGEKMENIFFSFYFAWEV